MLFNYLHCPGYVARSGTENIPLVGPVSRYQGCLYVQREAKREDASTHGGTAPQREPSGGVAMQLRDHLLSLDDKRRRGEWYAPFLLFPEGTTTNGRGLIQFKRGPFIAGLPARPYFIQYHKCLVSPAWETIGIKEHMWYMLAGLFHSATVTELPTYYPSEAERKDASLYAENFRQHMAKMAGVPTFDASLKDKRDYQEALRGLQARRGASAHSHVKSQ
ncbi:unnamed protein product [Pedinophyceae sp. YPF-701]|nr:unnamed protein product [Pedinophyceae sp. YPF-701]